MRRGMLLLAGLLAAACHEATPDDPVIARIGAEPIRRSEVSAPAAFRLYRYEAQSWALLEQEARRLADRRLLEQAAQREGIAPAALLARVEMAGPEVTTADVEGYLASHPGEGGPREARQARVRHYLEEHGRIERRLAFLAELRERAGFEWLLARPLPPRVSIDADAAPARGPADAPVTIIHLASFGSADSARSAQALARLARERPDSIRWLHVNLLRDDADEGGRRAAQLAFLAQDAGRFWEAHDALFARKGRLDLDAIATAAAAAGLAPDALARADRGALERRVEADATLARRTGALREPTLFVNGRYWSGLGAYGELLRILEEELAGVDAAQRASR
jgi:hypothetical protein